MMHRQHLIGKLRHTQAAMRETAALMRKAGVEQHPEEMDGAADIIDSWIAGIKADEASSPAAPTNWRGLYRTDEEGLDECLRLMFPDIEVGDFRTDGGSINMPKVRALWRERRAAVGGANG